MLNPLTASDLDSVFMSWLHALNKLEKISSSDTHQTSLNQLEFRHIRQAILGRLWLGMTYDDICRMLCLNDSIDNHAKAIGIIAASLSHSRVEDDEANLCLYIINTIEAKMNDSTIAECIAVTRTMYKRKQKEFNGECTPC